MRRMKLKRKLIGTTLGSAAALAAYAFLIRPWHLQWGATDEEVKMALPGDEVVEHPQLNATHAITIPIIQPADFQQSDFNLAERRRYL